MLDLSDERKVLFSLIGISLENENTVNFKNIYADSVDWDAVIKEARQQAVFLMAFDGLCRVKEFVPEEVYNFWKKLSYAYTKANMLTFYAISETDRIMNSGNFKYMVIKGLSSASYYPDYHVRILGDVDFLIDGGLRQNVQDALENEGYDRLKNLNSHHVVYLKSKQDLEMHFDYPGVPEGILGDTVREYLKDALDEAVPYSSDEGKYYIPKEKYHGLIILLHMQQHMLSEGLGLRHLIDWACFVKKTADMDFWDGSLLPVLRKIGLYKYAAAVTKTCSIYFNVPCPSWCEDFDEKICDEIMSDILSLGNFGRKDMAKSSSGMVISDSSRYGSRQSRLHSLWNIMIHAVQNYWPVVIKHPVLYPVVIPVYVSGRIWRVVTGKRAPLYKSMAYVNVRKSIYDRLEIFKT